MLSSADTPLRSMVVRDSRATLISAPRIWVRGLTSISGVDFESAWAQRIKTLMDDQPIALLGWDELIRNKRAAGRQKDLADLEKLLAIAKRNNNAG